MKIDVAGRARREIKRIDAWWRANRDSQELFKQELANAEECLASTPELASVYVIRRKRRIRWLLLPKTEVKLYYWIDEKQAVVHVVSAWGAAENGSEAVSIFDTANFDEGEFLLGVRFGMSPHL